MNSSNALKLKEQASHVHSSDVCCQVGEPAIRVRCMRRMALLIFQDFAKDAKAAEGIVKATSEAQGRRLGTLTSAANGRHPEIHKASAPHAEAWQVGSCWRS